MRKFLLLAVILSFPLVAFATPGGVGSSLQKGLIAHWPLTEESERMGDEMWDLDQSTFESGTPDWNTWGIATIANVNNTLEVTYGDSTLGAYHYMNAGTGLSSDLTIGKQYRLTFDAKTTGGSNTAYGDIELNPNPHTITTAFSNVMERYTLEFTASSTTASYFSIRGMSVGNIVTIDNISLKEIQTADITPYDNHGEVLGTASIDGPFAINKTPHGNAETDTGWLSYGTPLTNEKSTEQVKSGTYSRKFTTSTATAWESLKTTSFSLEEGKTYAMRYDLYGDGNSINFQVRRPSVTIAYSSLPTFTADTWTHEEVTFTATITADDYYLQIVDNTAISKTIYLDNLEIKEVGTATSFDGVDDYIEVTDSTLVGTNDFSISVWAKESSISNYTYILSNGGGGGGQGFGFLTQNSTAPAWTWFDLTPLGGTRKLVNFSATTGHDNTWHHYIATVDRDGFLSVYLDGSYIDQVDISADDGKSLDNQNLFIGRSGVVATGYLDGDVSDLRLYNRTLSATEVEQLYNQKSYTTATKRPSLEKGLVGHWPLSEENERVGSNLISNFSDTFAFTSFDFTDGVITATSTGPGWQGFQSDESFPIVIGETYRLTYDLNITSGTASDLDFFLGSGAVGSSYATPGRWSSVEGKNSVDFTATSNVTARLSNQIDDDMSFSMSNIQFKKITTADITPYDNHGEIVGATLATGVSGETNGAMSFDGTDDYINVGNVRDIGETTVTLWFKSDDTAAHNSIIDFRGAEARGHLDLNHSGDGRPLLYLASSNYRYFDASATSYLDDNWHFLVLYLKGAAQADITSATLHIDNASITESSTSSAEPPLAWTNLLIGRSHDYGTFDGEIADVHIYNRSLSLKEITQLYEKKGKQIGNKTPSLQSGLIGHWPLSGGYTNTSVFNDITPYDNNGTITGTTLTTGINGEAGGATDFDGVDDRVVAELHSTDSYTVAMWINPDTLSSSIHYFLEAESNNSLLRFSVTDSGTAVRYRKPDASYISYNLDSSAFTANTWTHITATYDGATDTLIGYTNGEIGITSNNIIAWGDFSGPIYIGNNFTNSAYFDGSITDVRIYNRALSTDEVKRLYEVR